MSAQANLHKYILEHQRQTDALIANFREVLVAYDQDSKQPKQPSALDDVIGGHTGDWIDRCEQHIADAGNNYYAFMLSGYRRVSFTQNCTRF